MLERETIPVSMTRGTWGRRYTIGSTEGTTTLHPVEAQDIIERFEHDYSLYAPILSKEQPPQSLDHAAIIEHNREILKIPPHERPIFTELSPYAQEYIRLEYAIRHTDDINERKILSAQLQRKVQFMFKGTPEADQMREDITRYGEMLTKEMQGMKADNK